MAQQYNFNKTRIAPTPSGYLHLGNILSFAVTAGLAKRSGAKILLRIDDLDRERANIAYVQDIFETLNYLGLPWDEGPQDAADLQNNWSQLMRTELYEYALTELADEDKVFACTCSRADVRNITGSEIYPGTCQHKNIPLDAPGACWRLKTETGEKLSIKTFTQGEIITSLPTEMNYFIVRKKDGHPSYQLASLIDDLHFGIDLIVRGDDLWPSTIAQHYLAKALNKAAFADITFLHHPLLTAADGQKLSKSAGATSVHYLRSQGKSAEEIYKETSHFAGSGKIAKTWTELAEALLPLFFRQ